MSGREDKVAIATALAAIVSADRGALLSRWHHVHGAPLPKSLSVGFLRKALSYEAQDQGASGPS